MAKVTAMVATEHGWKYVQQLCKHWAHKLDVELTDNKGVVKFSEAVATMTSDEKGLTVVIEGEQAEVLERMKGVVSSHLDRFAFREAPLPFEWQTA
ncbi:Uncharacterized conserved protein UCP028291 [Rhizobium sp. PDO1-076]|uniref:DUF2218 domain-containing protein n=1 Tax=Rhizobium sp. PDO1-076 TaxID=1125979 RepID=UPI00024E3E5F|nr:DUF2218 domain-containing protein [Rhizobium sp. PDO1-076]EHS51951.1 Uncharacterized conserved protein UCP028291 [Rhizobium sp. PDO1-076]